MKHLSILMLLLVQVTYGLAQADSDQTLSPFFQVISDDPKLDQLPLKHTEADVKIAGVIADVRISQVYRNEGSRPLEAIYTFPASTRAAVYGMTMTVGDRILEAKIQRRDQARKIYERAQELGQTASLLEQQRANIFTMNVANIQPGDSIVLELAYTELLVPEEGVYEFVYPTVVGPRYTEDPTSLALPTPREKRGIPFFHSGEPPSYTFGFRLDISAGMPIQSLNSPTHDFQINENGSKASMLLKESDELAANRDVVIRYSLEGDAIQSGMMTYRENGEKFFLLMAQPPRRVTPKDIPPREYIFIVDRSGSMNGFPLETSKAIMGELLRGMNRQDRFNVITFAGSSQILFDDGSKPATLRNIDSIILRLGMMSGSGGTSLLPALETGLNLPHDPGYSRVFVILTDGYVTVEGEAFQLIREKLNEANFFAFGIGSSVNRLLIEGIARAGQGASFVALNEKAADSLATKFKDYVEAPVLTDVVVHFGDMDAYDFEPLGIPDVFAERPVVVSGKYRGRAPSEVRMTGMTGMTGDGRYETMVPVVGDELSEDHRAIRYLWARQRIQRLSDDLDPQTKTRFVEDVTHLGLTYNLLTEQTSFVAVDKTRRAEEPDTLISQPLPMPAGVSDNAIAGLTGQVHGVMQIASSSGSTMSLEEVVVVGYATVRKSDFVGCISGANFQSISYRTVAGLDGQVSGIQVTPASGQPGSGNQIRIRGNTSIGGSQAPLIVIDGVPQLGDPTLTQGMAGIPGSASSVEQLVGLKSEDIESITILKDAAATAIYGSRASNGVILITTKSQAPGTHLTVSTTQGISTLRKQPELMESEAYQAMYKAATGEEVAAGSQPANWVDSLFRPAFFHETRLGYGVQTLQGKWHLHGRYTLNQGIIRDNQLQTVASRGGWNRSFSNRKGKLEANYVLSHTWGDMIPLGDSSSALLSRMSLAWMAPPIASGLSFPPVLNSLVTQGQARVAGTWKLTEDLVILSQLSGQYSGNQYGQVLAPHHSGPDSLYFQNRHYQTFSLGMSHHHQLTWNKTVRQHTFDLVLHGSQEWLNTDFQFNQEWDLSPDFTASLAGPGWESRLDQRLTSISLRSQYKFGDYLLMSYGQSLDQFTPFGTSWQYFPSGGVRIFMKEVRGFQHIHWLNQLDVLANFGLTGNAIGTRPYQLAVQQYFPVFSTANSTSQLSLARIDGQPDWSPVQKANVSLSSRIFNNVGLRGSLFNEVNQSPVWPVFHSQDESVELLQGGKIRQKGLELEASYNGWISGVWFNVAANYTWMANRVLALPGGRESLELAGTLPWGRVEVGEPLGLLYGYKTGGLYQEGDDFSAEPGKQPGDIKLVDVSGDGAITDEDRGIIGRTMPKALAGGRLGLRWKQFSLDILFSGAWGFDILNYQLLYGRDALTGETNGLAVASDFWTPDNTETDVPAPSLTPETRITDRLVESGGYWRITSAQLVWNPAATGNQKLLPEIGLRVENLVTISRYSGLDPVVQPFRYDPFLGNGVDRGNYPLPRTFSVRLSWAF